jgi:hypothetical protein
MLSRLHLVNQIKLFGLKALKQRNVINSLYRQVVLLKSHSCLQSLDLLETLLRYGDNKMIVDYQFSFFICLYQFLLNKEEHIEAEIVEDIL